MGQAPGSDGVRPAPQLHRGPDLAVCIDRKGNGQQQRQDDQQDQDRRRDEPAKPLAQQILEPRRHSAASSIGCLWMISAEQRSEEHTSELQSLMRISYAVFCLKKKKIHITNKI